MKIKDFCHVDPYLLAFKVHFFFLYGGYAGVMPFMPLIAKQLGISATALGFGFSMTPVFIFLSNPLIGFLVDYFQNIKKCLSVLLILSVTAYFAILVIPKINYDDDSVYIRIDLSNDSGAYLNISEPLERSCLEKLLDEKNKCELEIKDQLLLPSKTENASTSLIALNFSSSEVNQTHMFEAVDDKSSNDSNDSVTYLNMSEPMEKSCLEKLFDEKIQCKLEINDQFLLPNRTENASTILIALNFSSNKVNQTHMFETVDDKSWLYFKSENTTELDIKSEMYPLKLLHCSPNVTECSLKDKTYFVFSSYPFWTFIVTAVIAAVTSTSVMTLSSVGCCEKLGLSVEIYGRQRLFGTISWGIVCTLAGILKDIEKDAGRPFLSGFILMAVFIAIDIIIVSIMDIPKASISSNMCRDLGKIFRSREILIFALGAIFVGAFNSVIVVYEFWFLEDLGANSTLLGLAIAVQCLVGEVPFLFFSGWFENKLGHFLCLAAVFSAFTVRLISYSAIKNPWLALPVDSLHGLTFGLYHGAMTSFAKSKAPKGMEATLLGIYGGLNEGLGYGVGSCLGGIGMDYLGSKSMFFTTSVTSVGCILIFLVAAYAFRNQMEREIETCSENETNGDVLDMKVWENSESESSESESSESE